MSNLIRTFDEKGIQSIIKNKISIENLYKFLDKKLNEDSIDIYRELLDTQGNSSFHIAMKDKYIFDLILVLLYEEVTTIKNIKDLLNTPISLENLKLILEKAVVLELELFDLEIDVSESTNFDSKKYVRDYILNVYYSNPNKVSYKDYNNLENEINSIYSEFTLPSYLNNKFTKISLLRINDKESEIEGDNIGLYSFLINYNTLNKIFNRKKTGLINGFYTKVYNGTTEKIRLNDLITNPYLNYIYFNSLTENASNYSNSKSFVNNYREQLLKRTINY
jgi:hypothetical protein